MISFPSVGENRRANAVGFQPVERYAVPMTKLFIWIGVFVGGWVGWFLGDLIGFEFFGSFMVSSLGSIAGVFLGWKIADEYF